MIYKDIMEGVHENLYWYKYDSKGRQTEVHTYIVKHKSKEKVETPTIKTISVFEFY